MFRCLRRHMKFPHNCGLVVSFTNPYSYFCLRRSSYFYEGVDQLFIDGYLFCWLAPLMGLGRFERVSFDLTSMADPFFCDLQQRNKSLFVIGSTRENVALFVKWLANAYPKLNIVGYRDGYVGTDPADWVEVHSDIRRLAPNYVLCGMGAPLQERFLVALRESGWSGTGITCGGFIHQTALKGGTYYPKWIDELNLRFLYRAFTEPTTIKRYLFWYPIGVAMFVRDAMRFCIANLASNSTRGNERLM